MTFRLVLSGFLFIILFLLTLALAGCELTTADLDVSRSEISFSASENKILKSSENFGLRVFQELASVAHDKNFFISPYSISMALTMTLNGADNSTFEAMQQTLGFTGMTLGEINEACQSLSFSLQSIDNKVDFRIANSIWHKNSMIFQADFIQRNQEYFDADVRAVNFSDSETLNLINGWIEEKTNGKISNALDNIGADAIMYLINALYFRGEWTSEFNEKNTRERPFYLADDITVSCPMMQTEDTLAYFSNNDFEVIDLPYGNEFFSMMIILPQQSKNLSDVINELDSDMFYTIAESLQPTTVILTLPKFKVEYRNEIQNVLSDMGMGIAFDGRADFTKMYAPGGIYISRVIHQSFIEVNEKGTEAAAVTIVEIKLTSNGKPDSKTRMTVNRPFLFAIRERSSGSILFIGQITDPS